MNTATVREKPILFSRPMVAAILGGKKTQTRRVIKPFPTPKPNGSEHWWRSAKDRMMIDVESFLVGDDPMVAPSFCPHGTIGDQLWIRESWQGWLAGDYPVIAYPAGGGDPCGCDPPRPGFDIDHACWSDWKVRSSLYMPRWASRITLEITGVRIERLIDISSADCIAEGLSPTMRNETPAKERFRDLWDSINGKREGCDWKSNPWVWAISFRRIKP